VTTRVLRCLLAIVLAWAVLGPMPGGALAQADRAALVAALAEGGFGDKEAAIQAIAATGDNDLVATLRAMADGRLMTRKSDGLVVIAEEVGRNLRLVDPLTLEELEVVASGAVERIRVNNRLRRALGAAIGSMTLLSPDPAVRGRAADAVFASADPEALATLDEALLREDTAWVQAKLERARAAVILQTDADEATKLAAVETIAASGNRQALSLLVALRASAEGELQAAAAAGVEAIERRLKTWEMAQHVTYGLSLGSVLLLAAIGLAITFGVMGVINMAHGEMVMLGAYTTFVVQQAIRTHYPGLFDASLFFAIPLAFVVTGAVGIAIERGIIRHLYGRPLETLLATWGLSLILQQAVRTIFGPTNREVGNPSWMSGSLEIGALSITMNRLWIFFFALAVFALLLVILKRTSFGLEMRAVTQNRQMAGAMGIRTGRIDALTFGLGSGVAGLAGVALSQIDNVSPNLGQGYIIDSFMVVVFGGVGNLWGTLTGAMTLGVVNKFLEPYAGAVLGKILVLVLVILFIQKRPRGLFAQRGRAVEA
jgi:urea transport system permease protein